MAESTNVNNQLVESESPDVQLLAEYFPALRHVRIMYIEEALKLLGSGRGRLANTFSYVESSDKHSFRIHPG